MRYAIPALLAAYGIAHLPGFLVPWRWLTSPELPFKTTLLWGWVEVGEAGIRAIGIGWLLTGFAVMATAVGLARQAPWAATAALPVVLISGLLCFIELPHARIGLALNVVMCLVLGLHPTIGAGALRWRHATEAASGRLVALAHTPVGTSGSVSDVSRFRSSPARFPSRLPATSHTYCLPTLRTKRRRPPALPGGGAVVPARPAATRGHLGGDRRPFGARHTE